MEGAIGRRRRSSSRRTTTYLMMLKIGGEERMKGIGINEDAGYKLK
jgi:hypothetical protein